MAVQPGDRWDEQGENARCHGQCVVVVVGGVRTDVVGLNETIFVSSYASSKDWFECCEPRIHERCAKGRDGGYHTAREERLWNCRYAVA